MDKIKICNKDCGFYISEKRLRLCGYEINQSLQYPNNHKPAKPNQPCQHNLTSSQIEELLSQLRNKN